MNISWQWMLEGRHIIVLPSYIQHMEDFLSRRVDEVEKAIAQAETEGEKQSYYILVQYEIPESQRFLRESYLIALMAFLEGRLRWLCNEIAKTSDGVDRPPNEHELGRNTLDKIKEYLTKKAKIPFNFGKSAQWQEINNYKKVRDDLVHNGGIPNKSKGYVASTPLLVIKHRQIFIKKGFCEEATEAVSGFLNELVRFVVDHKKRIVSEANQTTSQEANEDIRRLPIE